MRYWVSWVCSEDDYRAVFKPKKGMTLMANEPRVLGWWCSGEAVDGSYSTLCALLEAKTDKEARTVIEKYWPEFKGQEWRIFNGCEDGWTPGDRFPME